MTSQEDYDVAGRQCPHWKTMSSLEDFELIGGPKDCDVTGSVALLENYNANGIL